MTPHCPVCRSDASILFKTKDFNRKISEESFTYFRCSDCRLVFLPKIPENLGDYYNDYYQFPPLKKIILIAAGERFKIEMVQQFAKGGKLLEIGPSIGVFAYQAKQAGFEVDTIEMSPECCEYLAQKIGVNAVNSDSPHKAMKTMEAHDVIALWHNIEHLPDPWACLDQVAKNLRLGGITVIAAPNPDAFGFQVLGSHWPHVDAPRHLNLIPVQVLIDYLRPRGLEPILITTKDQGAKYWNRFAWQVYLMNQFIRDGESFTKKSRLEWILWALLGYGISLLLAPFERRELKGSAYTVFFKKITDKGI
jgi:SAM-dependent methyltransferase